MKFINCIPELSEDKYRFVMVVLLGVFVIAFIIIGHRISENGRYAQYDHQKDSVVYGNTYQSKSPAVLDTRTGKIE